MVQCVFGFMHMQNYYHAFINELLRKKILRYSLN